MGSRLADIGSDHAYLPIYLCQRDLILSAIATDVNSGPVKNAEENIALHGLENKISARIGDGMEELDPSEYDTVSVCGMGGELIAALLSAECARFLRTDRVRLILQPMSRSAYLRHYLASEGFDIEDEVIVRDMGRQYEIMCAVYTGVPYTLTPIEAQLGKANIARGGEELAVLCERRLLHLKNLLGGTSGKEREETLELIEMLEKAEKEVLK